MEDIEDIMTKEELEEARREEMREILNNAFDGNSILFEIYKKRGWLDRLFTDRILSMSKEALYISNQVAEILETEPHVVKNKRRALLQYINPEEYGEGNAKIFKHNYISVFKMKMIHGLTGEASEYTLPQLKELIYGQNSLSKTNKSQDQDNEILIKLMRKMEQFEQFQSMVESGEFFEEIEKRLTKATERLMESNQDINELNIKIAELYDKIISPDLSITEKESLKSEFAKLAEKYPTHAFTINMYLHAAQERITHFERLTKATERLMESNQDINELNTKIAELYDEIISPGLSITEIESLQSEFAKLAEKYPAHAFTINMYLHAAQDRITQIKQVERELQVRTIKETVMNYYEAFETAKDDSERDIIRNQLQKLANDNQDLSYDIRFWLSTAGKEKKKKGFWSFLNR